MIDGKYGHFSVVQEPIAFRYTIPISDFIEEASTVLDTLHKLPNATELDYVELLISSWGGDVDTMIAFVDSLEHCDAHIHARVSGKCASAATLPLFKCDTIHVAKGTQFLFHNAETGFRADTNELFRFADFQKKSVDKLLKESYAGFLTEEELMDMIDNNRQIYMDDVEFMQRWNKYRGIGEQVFVPDSFLKGLKKEQLIDLLQGRVRINENMELEENSIG